MRTQGILPAGLKGLSRLTFPSFGGQQGPSYGFSSSLRAYGTLPGAQWNYELECGDLWMNSAVMPILAWIQRNFCEAVLGIYQPATGGTEKRILSPHPITELIKRPNDFYGEINLLYATLISWHVDGNAYWVKIRNKFGRPVQLWYVPHFAIAPQWDQKGQEYITHYLYRVNGQDFPIPVDDVIHFRNGVDPRNVRVGLAPLHALLREIFTDNEAATYSAAIMRNMGIPGVIISPIYPEVELDEPQRKSFIDLWKSKFRGENRGDPLVPSIPVKAEKIALTPDELALSKIRQVPEDRISAALGVPSLVVGLSSGHEQRTYSNYKEAREAAFENCIIPTQKDFAKVLQEDLLPDFVSGREIIEWNWAEVRVLQQDQDALVRRAVLGYRGGVLKRAEARAMLSKPVESGDDIYYTDIQKELAEMGSRDPGGAGGGGLTGGQEIAIRALPEANGHATRL